MNKNYMIKGKNAQKMGGYSIKQPKTRISIYLNLLENKILINNPSILSIYVDL